ncbi:hypothetical protein LINPERPRIM_LOCUS29895 [Linum perenne]
MVGPLPFDFLVLRHYRSGGWFVYFLVRLLGLGWCEISQ